MKEERNTVLDLKLTFKKHIKEMFLMNTMILPTIGHVNEALSIVKPKTIKTLESELNKRQKEVANMPR